MTLEGFIADILGKVYYYLQNHPDVLSPGSVRSYEYALKDIEMAINLNGGASDDLIIRVGVENLLNSVKVREGADKRAIIEEAFRLALMMVADLARPRPSGDLTQASTGGQGGLGTPRERGQGGGRELNVDLAVAGEGTRVENPDAVATMVYDAFYGSVGTMNFVNLAQLINMFVDPMAHIVSKVKVLRMIKRYLASYGIVQQPQGGLRVFRALDKIPRKASLGDTIKVSRFSEPSTYPSYVSGIREYRVGDAPFSIDLDKTSMTIMRKSMLGKPISTRDISVREYADVKMTDVILCLDTSGSMKEFSGPLTKMEIAKNAVAKYIRYLAKTNDRLSVILFNFRADILWKPHPVRRYVREMEELISYVYPGGGTNIANAIEKARFIASKSTSPNKHVICVTDGRTVNAVGCVKETEKLRRIGATLSAIAVGDNSDDDLLLRLSKIGNGLFIKIDDISNLDRALIIDRFSSL